MAKRIIVHIPHASLEIPLEVRKDILLDDNQLEREKLLMTDAYTDSIDLSELTVGLLQAKLSRLVVDVERFRDDELEPMSKVGMGSVYTRTHDGKPLRTITSVEREKLLQEFYDPHHEKFELLVQDALNTFDSCMIIDLHSFPSTPLPYEYNQATDRPDICIGTDDYHTPVDLASKAIQHFQGCGYKVSQDKPFSGAIVPNSFYRQDLRVNSLMIEINRRFLMDETTGGMIQTAGKVLGDVENFIESIIKSKRIT